MHPILFHLPNGLPVFSYGAMLGLSIAVGWYVTHALGARDGLRWTTMSWCYVVCALSALLGAKLLFLVTTPGPLRAADLLSGNGLVAYGAIVGGGVGAWAFCRGGRLPLLAWLDATAPSIALALVFTRTGCLLAGCDYGQPWTGPWAVQFPPGSPAFRAQVAEGLLSPAASA